MQEKRIDDYWNVDENNNLSDSCEVKTRQRSAIERHLLYRSGGQRVQRNHQKRKEKVGSAHGRSHALVRRWQSIRPACGKPQRGLKNPDKVPKTIRLYGGVSWIHKTAVGTISTKHFTKTILLVKDSTQWVITIWYTNLFLCRTLQRFRMRRQQWRRSGTSLKQFQRGRWTRSRAKWRSSKRHRKTKWKSTLLHLMDICHLKNSDVIARLPDCDGQAADAVSAYTQGKNVGCSQIAQISRSECPSIWIRLPRHRWPKSWMNTNDPVVPLKRNLWGCLFAVVFWERQFEDILLQLGWRTVHNWKCLFVHRKQGLFLSVSVDDIKMAGKKQNLAPMWKKLIKNVDLDEPTSFLDHVYLGCI